MSSGQQAKSIASVSGTSGSVEVACFFESATTSIGVCSANACAYALVPQHKFSQIFMVTVTCLWLGHVKIILDRRQTSNHVGHKSNAGLSDCSLGSESSGHAGFRKALNRFPPCLCASICHTGGEHVRIARSLVVLGGRQLRRWRPFSAPAALQAHPSRD